MEKIPFFRHPHFYTEAVYNNSEVWIYGDMEENIENRTPMVIADFFDITGIPKVKFESFEDVSNASNYENDTPFILAGFVEDNVQIEDDYDDDQEHQVGLFPIIDRDSKIKWAFCHYKIKPVQKLIGSHLQEKISEFFEFNAPEV